MRRHPRLGRATRVAMLGVVASFLAGPSPTGCIGQNCTGLTDAEPPGGEVTITLRNDTSNPIFVTAGQGCDWTPFTLEHGGKTLAWNRATCSLSCEDIVAGPCGCGADCVASTLIRLEPGAGYDITWDKTIFTDKNVSLECPADGCPTMCSRRDVAEDGAYTLSASAGTACADGNTACSCSGGATDCTLNAALAGDATLMTDVQITLPDDDAALLSFH